MLAGLFIWPRIAQYQAVANAQAQAALAKVVPTKKVFVARHTEIRQKLTQDDVRAIDWPENAIPEGAFFELTELFPENTDELRVVLRARTRRS